MSNESPSLVERIIDGWNNRDWEALAALHDDDYREHLAAPGIPPGIGGLEMVYGMYTSAFPDIQFELLKEVSDDDSDAYYWIARGTHEGEFAGIPATGKEVEIRAMTILNHLRAGKCIESWTIVDQMSLMQQLGVIPTPEE